MTSRTGPANRFNAPTASHQSQTAVAALVVATIFATALAGVVTGLAVLTIFAVGAGAGYSLSGSV